MLQSDWSYAVLSHTAKMNGGPERYIQSLISNSISKGRSQMIPVTIIASISAFAIGGFAVYEIEKHKQKATVAIEDAKNNLLKEVR